MESEFRQDLVSGDWVLIAPVRGRKPHQFKISVERTKRAPKKGCAFEHAGEQRGTGIISSYPSYKNWKTRLILNKFPAVSRTKKSVAIAKKGPISTIAGYGYHEILVTRDHNNNFPELSYPDAVLVFQLLQARYLDFSKDKKIAYASLFHNWGLTAGASLYHPHYQLVAIPVIPPDVAHSLGGAEVYFKRHRKCVHCTQLGWERREKRRIIAENKHAIAFCPFVSKEPFEMRVFPKGHHPSFEDTLENVLEDVVSVLQQSLKQLERALNYPDYNFLIHTTPVKDKKHYKNYHWHIEVVPRTTISAGFELGTAIEINPLDPDRAAAILKNV